MQSTTDKQTETIRVYREDALFDAFEKWWMLPADVLRSIHVCDYRYDPEHKREAIDYVTRQHPGCCLMYVD